MAARKKNTQTKLERKKFLHGVDNPIETKGKGKESAIATCVALVVGGVGGGLIGAAVGKPSLLVGMGVTGAGHYFGNQLATIFGVGMMASSGFVNMGKPVSGLDGLDGAKERMKLFADELKKRLYLDKLNLPKKTEAANAKPVGELQYFNYPDQLAYYQNNAYLDQAERIIEQVPTNFAHPVAAVYEPDIEDMIL